MEKVSYYTKEGLLKLKDELYRLKSVGRKDISKQIAEARDKGDLSENAEYDAAKEAQGHLEAKISMLEVAIGKAREIDKSTIDTSKITILSKVKVKNIELDTHFIYTIVAEEEADIKENKISIKSPIGRGLLGKKIGEKAIIKIPNGTVTYKVINITL